MSASKNTRTYKTLSNSLPVAMGLSPPRVPKTNDLFCWLHAPGYCTAITLSHTFLGPATGNDIAGGDLVHQNIELKITPDPKNPQAGGKNPQLQPNN